MQKIRPDMDIGKTISQLRRNKKMTQDEVLAQMQLRGVDISKSSYAKIETNRLNIKVSELVALREILGVSFDDFFADVSNEWNTLQKNIHTSF